MWGLTPEPIVPLTIGHTVSICRKNLTVMQPGRCLYLFLRPVLKMGALCLEKEVVLFQFDLLSGAPVMWKAWYPVPPDLTTSAFRELQYYSGSEACLRPCKTRAGCRNNTQEVGYSV